MGEPAIARFVRRARSRIGLAWEESRVAAPPMPVDPYAADAGETPFVPMRLADAASRFPSTVRFPTVASVERLLGVHATSIRLVAGAWTPESAGEVAPLVAHAAGWGRILPAGERLFWVQPLSNNFVLSVAEVEQIAGLAGAVELVEETRTPDDRPRIVAAVTVRPRACATALVWATDLVADGARLEAALAALARMPDAVRAGVHIVESPAGAGEAWRAGATRVLSALAVDERTILGVRVDAPSDAAAIVALVSDLPQARHLLRLQWIRRVHGDDIWPLPPAVAPGITCDCSLAAADPGSARPYVTAGAYVPIAFDARVPTFAARRDALVEIPRVDGANVPARDLGGWRLAVTSPEREAERALAELVDAPIDSTARRLQTVLDLDRRQAYLDALATSRGDVVRWHEFHVYNWPAPPRAILRLVAYDAADLTRRTSALAALEDLRSGRLVTGDRFVAAAQSMAHETVRSAERIREQQIEAHGYLASGGRQELSADGEHLIARLPATLGSTLEIGFGYALTAKRIAARATRYVGIDLQTEQARTLREAGGTGLVADIQALPLADGSFDTVIADNVLEHASSPLDALRELRRVLRPRGRIYALVPLDAATSDFQIRTHLWKADERSIRRAAALSGFQVVALDVLEYAALQVYGCFPASAGRTCLFILEPAAVAAQRIAV